MSAAPPKNSPLQAPVNPEFSRSIQKGLYLKARGNEKPLGFLPHPLKLDHLMKSKALARFTAQALPSSFDLRKKGRVSPVKDQGPAGTCWAFASYGSMESCLLPGKEWDFSENNMVNLLSENCPEGYDREPTGGGNQFMAMGYLARWNGPVSEAEDHYHPGEQTDCRQYDPQKHLNRVLLIPDRKTSSDNASIKTGIMNYGAMFTSIYFEEAAYQEENNAYYYKGSLPSNHAICLIGWDDKFDRKRFRSSPPQNGAFIAKNSWGTSWGNQGYFYISYYDARVGSNNALFNRVDPETNFNTLYQYDPLGWVTSVGYGSSEAWLSNVYQSTVPNKIGAVSWYAASPSSTYEIYIYQSPAPGDPRSGKLLLNVKGTVEAPSYFTRLLSSPLQVDGGKSFSLVLKLNTPGFNYPVPVQMPIEGYSSKARSNPGQSFLSNDGIKWDDLSQIWENSSVCLKALANS